MIYLLDAKDLDDKTLGKQIEAIAQVLCQIHYQWIDYNAETIGDANHAADKIPIKDEKIFDSRRNDYADWGYTCKANYLKLVEMGLECCAEYSHRFARQDIKQ